jgi:hypothetical protein
MPSAGKHEQAIPQWAHRVLQWACTVTSENVFIYVLASTTSANQRSCLQEVEVSAVLLHSPVQNHELSLLCPTGPCTLLGCKHTVQLPNPKT